MAPPLISNDMNTIQRFSSRRQRLDRAFLAPALKGARAYRRIAGYFRSSIFELIGEAIAAIPDVRILCNSELDLTDIAISKAAREAALKEKWNQIPIETEALLHRDHYRQLYSLLTQGNIQIRVVPKDRVFLHGKAGVIERADGSKTSFLGSVNETRSAFAANYEILWEDPSPEGVAWIEEEFAALWQDAILRHTVLRRREILEQQGLLDRVGVDIHPDPVLGPGAYSGVPFVGLGLLTNHAFNLAYQAVESFTHALGARTRAAGFIGLFRERPRSSGRGVDVGYAPRTTAVNGHDPKCRDSSEQDNSDERPSSDC
jgi:hypothetical protein